MKIFSSNLKIGNLGNFKNKMVLGLYFLLYPFLAFLSWLVHFSLFKISSQQLREEKKFLLF